MPARDPTPSVRASWLGRNWKWVVPVGCLSAIVALMAAVAGIVLAVFGLVRSSDVYRHALTTASASEAVVEALGEPIEPGWYLTGSIDVEGASGRADISIPIEGPNGEGTIFVSAEKRAGRWDYSVLEVEVEGREARIDLRSSSAE